MACGATYASGSTVETITCNIPSTQEAEAAKRRLAGYGLFYGASATSSAGDGSTAVWCPTGQCSLSPGTANRELNRFDNFASDSVANLMGPICYGPKVQFLTSYHVRYSGYDIRSSSSNPDQVFENHFNVIGVCDTIVVTNNFINNTQTIPDINGDPLVDDFFTWMHCDYSGAEGTERIYNVDNPPYPSVGTSDPSVVVNTYCNSRLFAKQCGDGADTFSVTFLNVSDDTGNYPYTPSTWTKTTAGFSSESTTPLTATVTYGPTVNSYTITGAVQGDNITIGTDVYDVWYASLNSVDILDLNPDSYSAPPVYGTITVDMGYLDDWVAPTNHLNAVSAGSISMWGTQRATCLFGTISNTDPVTLIHQANTLGANARSFIDSSDATYPFVNYFTDLTTGVGGSFAVTCNIPQGAHGANFDSWGSVYVLLDPHIDQWTEILSPADADEYSSNFIDNRQTLTAYWHWTPFVDYAVKDWTAPGFVEPIVFHGFGFQNYQTLSCSFGTVAATATILNDQLLVCQTPPYLTPQTVDVTFIWGTSSDARYQEFCPSARRDSIDAYDICNLDNVCKNSFDCKNTSNSFVLPGFEITGIVSFCPKSGPVVGNTHIDFQSIGLDNYIRVECVFHFSGGDQIVGVVQRNTSTEILYSCPTPQTTDPEHVLVTVQGYYTNLWTSTTGLGIYSTNLGSFWFDYDIPYATSVSPSSVTYGSSATITINGNYFTGGSDPVPETGDPLTWNYYCAWQVPVTQDLLTIPVDGLAPTFASKLTSYATPVNVSVTLDGCDYYTTQFTCLTPNFQQFGHYYFEFVFDGIHQTVPAGFTQLFTVLPQALSINTATATLGFLNASATDEVALAAELTISGTGFAGGRVTSNDHTGCYLCKFDDPNAIDTIYPFISVADFVSSTELQCFTPYINVGDTLDAYFNAIPNSQLPQRCANKPTAAGKTVATCMNFYCSHSWNLNKAICNPDFLFAVSASNDCGYTWSNTVDVTYHFPFPASASLVAPVLMVLLSLFAIFFF